MSDMDRIITFITDQATTADIDRINRAVRTRNEFFRGARAATVYVGAEVELTNIKPKTLAGLQGEVTQIKSERCDVRLTRSATQVLAASGIKFGTAAALHADDDGRYTIHGVPLSACAIQ
jgi:hypothetical protein